MKKLSEFINKPKNNVIGIFIALLLSWIIGMSTNLPQSSGHGGFIPIIYPPFMTIFFLTLYFVSRIFTKKLNWIISVFAIVFLIYFAIDFYLTENI